MMNEVCSIWQSKLNKRTIHRLLEADIKTIDALLALSTKELMRIPGIGKETLAVIQEYINITRQQNNPLPQMLQDIGAKLMSVERKVNVIGQVLEKLTETKLTLMAQEINSMRTVMLEQYRLLEAIQLEKSPDGLLRKINEKVPGFSATVYDLYSKLEQM